MSGSEAVDNSSCQAGSILGSLKQLSAETWDFITNPIDTIHVPVDPCTFLRQYVGTNHPVLIRGATDHWPATELWNQQYLNSRVGTTEISVELTPNGLGDAVTAYTTDDGQTRQCFCMPHSSHMLFKDFTKMFFQSKQQQQDLSADAAENLIPYLSVSYKRQF